MTYRLSGEVKKSLAPLFNKADKKGLWFRSKYQGLWYSPDELRSQHSKGQMRWGAVNWELVDPKERIKGLKQAVKQAKEELEVFEDRVKFENKS